ncbi:NADH-quinone oxidoreductase subunit I [Dysgonomonas sp. PH5-45]|nr:NADH-quinone oxidoreductase subunit I [Dysgonomonas sp. PH5-45]MDH6388644.1 NADH-quinone oxidoreductase subunit I [Dysgonomonas sp. PH5-37]
MTVSQYFSGLFKGIASLIKGLTVTWKELWTPKITQQYPENRATLVISDRFRAELVMPHDENNEHACTACGICQMNCPNGTIKVISKTVETEDGKKKKILDEYHYDQGMCTFCNLCVITCPSDAIKFENTFENAVFTRGKLDLRLNREGSKMREKKKPEPKPAPTAATAEAPKAETPAPKPAAAEVKPVAEAPEVKTAPAVEEPKAPEVKNDTETKE